jgi:hypothetical protein
VGEEKNAVVAYDGLAGIGVVVGLRPHMGEVVVCIGYRRWAIGDGVAVEICRSIEVEGYLLGFETNRR